MKTIVVIEDQQVLASAYRNKFAGEGFKVEVATDGELKRPRLIPSRGII